MARRKNKVKVNLEGDTVQSKKVSDKVPLERPPSSEVAGKSESISRITKGVQKDLAFRRSEVADHKLKVIASNLRYPRSPLWLSDGSVLLLEAERKTVSRVVDESVEVVVELGGYPTSITMGPDGKAYICNAGNTTWTEVNGETMPGVQANDYTGGKVQVLDLKSGSVETLYDDVNGIMLRNPCDLVFDSSGGFWFTDSGKVRGRQRDHGGIYYAKADGSHVSEVIYPLDAPTGIGLSPNEDMLYVAESKQGRVYRWPLRGAGSIAGYFGPLCRGQLLADPEGGPFFESMAVDSLGNVCLATPGIGITTVTPEGASRYQRMSELVVTSLDFGGKDRRSMLVAQSGVGKVVSMPWDVAGLAPRHVL